MLSPIRKQIILSNAVGMPVAGRNFRTGVDISRRLALLDGALERLRIISQTESATTIRFGMRTLSPETIISSYIRRGKAGKLSMEEIAGFHRMAGQFDRIKVAMLSGGTGSNTICGALNDDPNAELSILINAYDDGKSTGKIRHDFGILGPSDIAKNLVVLCGSGLIKEFLEIRFTRSTGSRELMEMLERVSAGLPLQKTEFENAFESLPKNIRKRFGEYIKAFYEHALECADKKGADTYDLADYGVRNIVFAGALFLNSGYVSAIEELRELLGIRATLTLNDYRPLWLAGITDKGGLLRNEAAVTKDLPEQEILSLFLLKAPLTEDSVREIETLTSIEEKVAYLESRSEAIDLSPECSGVLKEADTIVTAPTTFHSSYAPTIMTRGFCEAYLNNRGLKISIANLVRERGLMTAGEYLSETERLFREMTGQEVFAHNIADYIIVNTHGYRADETKGKRHIPVDLQRIKELGITVIEADIEDPDNPGKHIGSKAADLIMSLSLLAKLGLRYDGKRIVSAPDNDRAALSALLKNPIDPESERILELSERILEVTPGHPALRPKTCVIIEAAGRSSRFLPETSKALYPFQGKPCIQHLAERAFPVSDDLIILTNSQNDRGIREALNSAGIRARTLIVEPNGTGRVLLDAEYCIPSDINDIVVLWGDAPNISQSSILRTLMVHKALGNSQITLPTCWQDDPYAGIERDKDGNVTGIFQTKDDPEKKRRYGEHDFGLFIFKKSSLFSGIRRAAQDNASGELDLLQAFRYIATDPSGINAVPGFDQRESVGFNTIEEASRVQDIMDEFGNNNAVAVSYADLLVRKMANLTAKAGIQSAQNKTVSRDIMEKRFRDAIDKEYHALIFDIDGNITDSSGNIPNSMIDRLIGLATRGIKIGFISGRKTESMKKLIHDKIAKWDLPPEILENFYSYPACGSTGFRLDDPDRAFYDHPIPSYVISAAMRLLRKHFISFSDTYYASENKIMILPRSSEGRENMPDLINYLFELAKIPLRARIGDPNPYSFAVIITNDDGRTKVDKGAALRDFSQRTGIGIDDIAKIADCAMPNGVDHEMLVGKGSFSSDRTDSSSEDQISIPALSGKRNEEAIRWLLPQLRITAKQQKKQ